MLPTATDSVYTSLVEIYKCIIIFTPFLCFGMLVLTGFWVVYFTNNLFLNYRAYKSYKQRFGDEDSQQRKRTKKILIIRDLLILGVIASEFLTSIFLLLEIVDWLSVTLNLGETQKSPNNIFTEEFNCNVNVTADSMFLFLHNLSLYGTILEGVRQSLLLTQVGLYWSVVVFLTQVYRSNDIHMKPVYQILALTLIQVIVSFVLISFIRTYILGYSLSVLFLSAMAYIVVKHSTKKLKLQIQFRLQDISLVDNMDARQEYERTKKVLSIYKRTVTWFSILLFILVLGEFIFCVATVWVEWIVLLQCHKLKPSFLLFTPGEIAIQAVRYSSKIGRILQNIGAILFYVGLILMSIVVAFQKYFDYLRKIRKRRPLYSPLI